MTHLIPLLLATGSTPALAYEDGVVGRAATGCGACHGGSADADVTVTLELDSDVVEPGDTVGLTLRVESADSAHTNVGFDLAVADGRLAAGSGMLLREGELTHSYPFFMTDGVYEATVDWTAPTTEGEVLISVAANAVNFDSAASALDGWTRGSLRVSVDEVGGDDGGSDDGGSDDGGADDGGGWDSGGTDDGGSDDGGWDSGGSDDGGGDDGGWDSGGSDDGGGDDGGGDDGGGDDGSADSGSTGDDGGGDDGGTDDGGTDDGGTDDGGTDDGGTDDSGTDDGGTDGRATERPDDTAKGCSAVGAPVGGLVLGLLGLAGLSRRRDRGIRAAGRGPGSF